MVIPECRNGLWLSARFDEDDDDDVEQSMEGVARQLKTQVLLQSVPHPRAVVVINTTQTHWHVDQSKPLFISCVHVIQVPVRSISSETFYIRTMTTSINIILLAK